MHVTWHVEPPVHDTLPLAPTVTLHVEPPLQSMLHDSWQVPVHSLSLLHINEQLAEDPHALSVKSHEAPAGHEQLAPVQLTGSVSLPQAESPRASARIMCFMRFSWVSWIRSRRRCRRARPPDSRSW